MPEHVVFSNDAVRIMESFESLKIRKNTLSKKMTAEKLKDVLADIDTYLTEN